MEDELEPTPQAKRERGSSPARAAVAAEADAEIDAILDKIAKQGIGSLSPAERDALQRATDRRRGSSRDGSSGEPPERA